MKTIGAFVTLLGATLVVYGMWAIFTNPFVGTLSMPKFGLMTGLAAFLCGICIAGWGTSKFVGVGARV